MDALITDFFVFWNDRVLRLSANNTKVQQNM